MQRGNNSAFLSRTNMSATSDNAGKTATESHPSAHDLHSDLRRRWAAGEDPSADLVLVTADAKNPKDKEFHVHSALLRIHSPVFDAMLTHDCAEKSERRVEIADIGCDQMEAFVQQLYYGNALPLSTYNIKRFFPVAHKYMVKTLIKSSLEWMNEARFLEEACPNPLECFSVRTTRHNGAKSSWRRWCKSRQRC